MEKEIWKPIKNWENIYEISNTGKIRSVERTITAINGRSNKPFNRIYPSKIRVQRMQKDGYMEVNLSVNQKSKLIRIHRLVAEAFIANPKDKPQVNHIDGNKTNNHVSNLEWNTQSENQIHAYKTKLQIPNLGPAKLNIDECSEICEAYATGLFTYTEIAKHHDMTVSNIRRMIIGESYHGAA